MLERLKKQQGFLYLIECLCVAVFCMCICIVTAGSLGPKILGEIADIGSALGALNQSFTLTGFEIGHPNDLSRMPLGGDPTHCDMPPGGGGSHCGCGFIDTTDFCDQDASCGIRACIAATTEAPGGSG